MLAAFARTASRRTMLSAAARTHARMASTFMTQYQATVAERAEMGIVPQPLDAGMTSSVDLAAAIDRPGGSTVG